MNTLSRRDFLKIGASSALGLTLGKVIELDVLLPAQAQELPLEFAFLIEPGTVSQIDITTYRTFNTTLWGIPSELEPILPILLSPVTLPLENLESWARERKENCECSLTSVGPTILDPLDVLMGARLAGVPDMTDIVGASAVALIETKSLDLTLDFLIQRDYVLANRVYLPLVFSSSPQHVERSPINSLPSVAPNSSPPPHIELFGWRLQFRTDRPHSFGDCVRRPVNHFHIEVFRHLGRGRYQYVVNFHIGAYRDAGRRCFVLWNNYRPVVCWKTCLPTRDELERMLRWAIAVAALLAGVMLAAWIIAIIANVAATALLVPLLLLPVPP